MDEAHRADVLKLWKDNMSDRSIGNVLDQRYAWLYGGNPEGAARTVIAVQEPNEVTVGCGSLFPRRVAVGGRLVRIGIPADFAVDPRHRIGGAALSIQRRLADTEAGDFSFLLAFPNRSSAPILRRIGYQPVGSFQGWIKPLRASYKVAAYVKNRSLAALTATPINWGIAAVDALRPQARGSGRAEIVARADERFDELWATARGNYAIAGERSAAYLNWRYADFPTTRHHFFCLTRPDSDVLEGYVAFCTTAQKVFIADLFARDMKAAAERVIVRFAQAMRKAGMQSVFIGFVGNGDFARRLRKVGFFSASDQDRQVLAWTTHLPGDLGQLVMNVDNWYLFEGELDI